MNAGSRPAGESTRFSRLPRGTLVAPKPAVETGLRIVALAALFSGCATSYNVPTRHRIFYDPKDEASEHAAKACVADCETRADEGADFYDCFDRCPNAEVSRGESCVYELEPKGSICITSVRHGDHAEAARESAELAISLLRLFATAAATTHANGDGNGGAREDDESHASHAPRRDAPFPQSERHRAHPRAR
jgi:hypothetical protein